MQELVYNPQKGRLENITVDYNGKNTTRFWVPQDAEKPPCFESLQVWNWPTPERSFLKTRTPQTFRREKRMLALYFNTMHCSGVLPFLKM